MKISLSRTSGRDSNIGVCSLPVLPGQGNPVVAGVVLQTVPVGFWPDAYLNNPSFTNVWDKSGWQRPQQHISGEKWPRRLLTLFEFQDNAPSSFELEMSSITQASIPRFSESGDASDWVVHVTEQEQISNRDECFSHYCRDEGAGINLTFRGTTCMLRFGWIRAERKAWFQWANAERLWSGPLAEAWQFGGHIYAGPQDRPLTIDESARWFDSAMAAEQMIAVKIFAVLLKNGNVELSAHFVNGELYGQSGFIAGKPLIFFESEDGISALENNEGAWTLDTQLTDNFGGNDSSAFPGDTTAPNNCLEWLPFADTRQVLGRRPDSEGELTYITDSEKGFPRGCGRTVHFRLTTGCAANSPVRYLASARHYLLAAELTLPWDIEPDICSPPPEFEALPELSRVARAVHLRNEMTHGFCSGGAFRYLDGYPDGRWEFSNDGNETAAFFRGSYLHQDGELFDLALRNADFGADLNCDHANFAWHYHEPQPLREIYSLIYMRFGGLVHAHLETGDPYYLEIAEAVANRWISTHRTHWPRRGVGRDSEPLEGILLLYDFTGQEYYFNAARQAAQAVVASLYPDGSWRSGAGAGPFWGMNALQGSPWNGAHLLAGLAEFALRASPGEPTLSVLLERGALLLRRSFQLLAETDDFHRATLSYAWRRHYGLVELVGDAGLKRDLRRALRAALARFEEEGEAFFRAGHHCAGYIDNPWFFLASQSQTNCESDHA